MQVIPSLDILDGQVVRLVRGEFASARSYGEPGDVLDSLHVPPGSRLHLVDLEGSRRGRPIETEVVSRLAARDLEVQIGGGIRSIEDARRWLDCGAARLVVGTVAASSPHLLSQLVDTFGHQTIIPAIDVKEGVVRTDGWERESTRRIDDILTAVESLGIREVLITDISHDGVLKGPSFALYRRIRGRGDLNVIASGGVTSVSDLISLSRIGNISGAVIGRALLEGKIDLKKARTMITSPNTIPERIIPCLDVRDGRVVKGVSFTNIRDAGDPVECAVRYEAEGADELVILDISATDRGSGTALDTVHRVAESLFIPLTVGGGVRTRDDFRSMLRAGADRVAINTAALRRPELIRECADEFGVQAVVLSCDAKRDGDRWVAAARGGRELTDVDVVEWCIRAEAMGAGEILLTSVDRDGTNSGFDIELLRAVSARLKIGVIASGGAGTIEDFSEAIESGGARAVLAASLFHDRQLTISDVKQHLAAQGIPIRRTF
jgi:imidazole glycerol-phosphate synthase subunit HisF